MDSIKKFAEDFEEHGELNEEKLIQAIRTDYGFHDKVIKFIVTDIKKHLFKNKDLLQHLTDKIKTTQLLIHTMKHANM